MNYENISHDFISAINSPVGSGCIYKNSFSIADHYELKGWLKGFNKIYSDILLSVYTPDNLSEDKAWTVDQSETTAV